MIDRIQALRALREAGTTARAAARLRVTQSAVSKRIAALEAEVGVPLVERVGRGCRLTAAAETLLAEAEPLLSRLAGVLAEARGASAAVVLRVAASESLLSSWLPGALVSAAGAGLELELHAHRGPVLVERVRSGECELGICAAPGASKDLVESHLGDERMVLVPSRLGRRALERAAVADAWTIEERSLTWPLLAARLARRRSGRPGIAITGRLESFTALVRCARAGLCHALVPRGVALAMGVPARALLELPGLTRPIAIVARSRTLERAPVARFARELARAWPAEA